MRGCQKVELGALQDLLIWFDWHRLRIFSKGMSCRNSHDMHKQMLVENSADKNLVVPHLDIISLNTYQSLEFRSEKSMAMPSAKANEETHAGTCLRIPEDIFRKHISDETFMLKFLMVCIKNERMNRISERTAMRQQHDGQRLSELTEEYNALRHTDMLRSAEHKCLKD